jgi:hypothetical protein
MSMEVPMRRCAVLALLASVVTPALAAPDLCALLTPADFQAAGIAGAKPPTRNGTGNDAYCVYAGKSSGTGGIELDVFIAPDANEAKATYNEMRGAPGKAVALAADQAETSQRKEPAAFTFIAVRKGKLVFGLGVPTTAKSQEQVTALAKLVLQRGDGFTR